MTIRVADYEQAVIDGIEARNARDGAQWRLGDLALLVETKYAEHTLEEYAERVGIEHEALKRYRLVSERFESGKRLPNLGWSHYNAIASRDDRLQWLGMAEERKWSIKAMLAAIEEADAEAEAERQRQARAEAFKSKLQNAGILDRWQPGKNDDEMLSELARLQEQERQEEQAKLDYEGRLRRARERLAQLLMGWIELEALPSNPEREPILAGLTKDDRQKVERIESMYRRCGNGRDT